MKLLLATFAAGCLLAPEWASAAELDLASTFKNICVETRADSAMALANARALGFVTPPPSLAQAYAGFTVGIENPTLLWANSEGAILIMATGHAPFPKPNEPSRSGDLCAIIREPAVEHPDQSLISAVGGPPPLLRRGTYVTIFTDRNGVREVLDPRNRAALDAATRSGPIEIASANNESGSGVEATQMSLAVLSQK